MKKNASAVDAPATAIVTDDKKDLDSGHFGAGMDDKNVPLYLLKNPFTSLKRAKPDDDMRLGDQRGDEKIELEAARLLGQDGYAILSGLHEIDGGQPRLRLLALVREGKVTARDLDAARLAAKRSPGKRRSND